jgi:hypothetical protein
MVFTSGKCGGVYHSSSLRVGVHRREVQRQNPVWGALVSDSLGRITCFRRSAASIISTRSWVHEAGRCHWLEAWTPRGLIYFNDDDIFSFAFFSLNIGAYALDNQLDQHMLKQYLTFRHL